MLDSFSVHNSKEKPKQLHHRAPTTCIPPENSMQTPRISPTSATSVSAIISFWAVGRADVGTRPSLVDSWVIFVKHIQGDYILHHAIHLPGLKVSKYVTHSSEETPGSCHHRAPARHGQDLMRSTHHLPHPLSWARLLPATKAGQGPCYSRFSAERGLTRLRTRNQTSAPSTMLHSMGWNSCRQNVPCFLNIFFSYIPWITASPGLGVSRDARCFTSHSSWLRSQNDVLFPSTRNSICKFVLPEVIFIEYLLCGWDT